MLQVVLTVITLAYAGSRWLERRAHADNLKQRLMPLEPRVDEGSRHPLIFGRVRIRTPVLLWFGRQVVAVPDPNFFNTAGQPAYSLCALFAIGVPFASGTNKIHKIYLGDTSMQRDPLQATADLDELTGDGNWENTTRNAVVTTRHFAQGGDAFSEGTVEFLNGKSTQLLVEPVSPHNALTYAGAAIGATPYSGSFIPGLRGFMSAFLGYSSAATSAGSGLWTTGTATTIPQYSFEVSSYPPTNGTYFAGFHGSTMIGVDANPAHVIASILCDTFGKLGIGLGTNILHQQSFAAAASTLASEWNGYSRAVEDGVEAEELLSEIIHQIDGALYVNPFTGLWHLKLIRPDYNPNLIPQIYADNCERIDDFTMLSPMDLPSTVHVKYRSRLLSYTERNATARDHANADGQPGGAREVTIDMPGVCTAELAEAIAARELAAISRPLKSCRAVVDRSFLGRALPGDAVSLSLPAFHLSGVIFRVVGVDLGVADSNSITLTLVEDHFYVHRSVPTADVPISFPGQAVAE